MNTFDRVVHHKLLESVTNLSKDDLDPTVFQARPDGLPILRDSIKIQILKDIDEIRAVLPVVRFFIIGSILTKNYDHVTDLDVSVQVDEQLVDSIAVAEVMYLLKRLNGRMASDTTHPINYYIVTEEYDESKAEAIYDVVNDRWIKEPKTYEPDVEKWSLKFQDTLKSIDVGTGELRRDLIDMAEIMNLGTPNVKRLRFLMKQKLSQIDELVKQLINTNRNVKTLRQMAFDRFMTPAELQLYGARNQLPENILYKLLEKYYYTKFIKKLESILDDRNELELTDVPEIKRAMGDLWKTLPNS